MIDVKLLRESPEIIKTSLKKRGLPDNIFESLITLDKTWRQQQQKLEELQSKRNQATPKGKPSDDERKILSDLSNQVKDFQQIVTDIKNKLDDTLFQMPNILQDDVPKGNDESDNVVIRTVGQPKTFDFQPKSHDELATNLDIIDFERGTKITGSRFAIFKGLGAKLERAISNFMLDIHIDRFGYQELSPPVIVNSQSMTGTGQLPKFEDDSYKISDDYWLSPTAEVQLTNYHYDEILLEESLPIKYCALTECFRKEAGNYGKDMKGIIRLHEFNKVELVQLASPSTSNQQLDELLSHAEYILQALELPYRVVLLCSGDTGFSSSKTYDIEVWFPSQNKYREISSCSNFLNFQSKRSKIRYRDSKKSIDYIHTINGSGLAVGRTLAAILENYQDKSGIINIPKELVAKMGIQEIV